MKASAAIDTQPLNTFFAYAQLCGVTLARAHARSGDPAMMAGYMGKSEAMEDALASFAMAYAKRTKQDYDLLAKAKGAKLRVAPVDDRGQIIFSEYEKLLGPKTRIVSFSMVYHCLC